MTVRLAELPDINALEVPDTRATPAPSGKPLLLPCELIDEDPDQPRTAFDDESLRELAATIAERGVRQPVSVRRHPTVEARWMLNFGARRLRASKLVGKTEIPAFVDEAVDSYDQVIENEQRQGLKPLELALFVKRQLDAGDGRAEIAKRLGKSASMITYACALIDAPDWLLDAYRDGRCTGLREIYELRQAHERDGESVEAWAAARDRVSRAALKNRVSDAPTSADVVADACGPRRGISTRKKHGRAHLRSTIAVEAKVNGARVHVVLDCAPDDADSVFVVSRDCGDRTCVHLSKLEAIEVTRTQALREQSAAQAHEPESAPAAPPALSFCDAPAASPLPHEEDQPD